MVLLFRLPWLTGFFEGRKMPRAWRILLENRLAAKMNAGEASRPVYGASGDLRNGADLCCHFSFLTTIWTDPPTGRRPSCLPDFPRLTTGFSEAALLLLPAGSLNKLQ